MHLKGRAAIKNAACFFGLAIDEGFFRHSTLAENGSSPPYSNGQLGVQDRVIKLRGEFFGNENMKLLWCTVNYIQTSLLKRLFVSANYSETEVTYP
jgi:hypothetical protein